MVLAGVRQAWTPLRSQWLGERVLMAVDDRALQAVALRRGAITTPYWESMLPAQSLVDGMPTLVDTLGDFLGDLLLSQGLMGQAVRLALPPQACHWRVVVWPLQEWPDDPLEALRTIDPDLGLPFALADAAIDLQPLPGEPLRSLLVAAPRELVEAWLAVFAITGSPLERLLPAQVCLRQALLPALEATPAENGVLLLHPTVAGCTALLWRQGLPLYERMVPLDAARLPQELERCVAFYRSRDPGFKLSQLWLTAPLPGQDQLAATLGMPLELLDSAPYASPVLQGLALGR
jgi:Tfp pilus assembly PilM family ATPase